MKRAAFTAAIAAACALFGGLAAANAEDAQMKVRLSGIDVGTEAGAGMALSRIRQQVGAFCQAGEGRRSLDGAHAVDRCMSAMTQKAVVSLNAPLVTALYDGRPAPTAAPVRVLALVDK